MVSHLPPFLQNGWGLEMQGLVETQCVQTAGYPLAKFYRADYLWTLRELLQGSLVCFSGSVSASIVWGIILAPALLTGRGSSVFSHQVLVYLIIQSFYLHLQVLPLPSCNTTKTKVCCVGNSKYLCSYRLHATMDLHWPQQHNESGCSGFYQLVPTLSISVVSR